MFLNIKLDMSNAAFKDSPDVEIEIAIKSISEAVAGGQRKGSINDTNGKVCGVYNVTEQTAAPDLLAACKELLIDAKENVKCCGPCDHDVDICVCGLISNIEDAEAAITLAEKGE